MFTNRISKKKLLVSTVIALLVLSALASMAFASQTNRQLPFKGSLQAVENNEVNWPTIYVHANGSGNANKLGKFTVTYEGVVQNDENGIGTGSMTAQLVAANGDSLFAEATGIGSPTENPGINKIVEEYTITGGTGRFADARGNFTVERTISLETGVTSGTIEGTILLSK